MTPKQQIRYIMALFAVFITVIPVVIFYSYGYRLSDNFKIVKTGGLYVSNSEAGASVMLNGKVKKYSGLIDRNMLVQNLKPGSYTVNVQKNGYRPWEKYIRIQEQLVEVCFPLLVPSEFKSLEIPKYIPAEKPSQNKKRIKYAPNGDYQDVVKLFKDAKKPAKSIFPLWNSRDILSLKLGPMRKLKDKVLLTNDGNRIFVKWVGKKEQLPFFINTMNKKQVYAPEKGITAFEFYPKRNDSFIVRLDDGSLYAVEIDTRFGMQNSYRIVKYCDRFIVHYEMLFYFIGDQLYSIDFESQGK